MSGRQRELGIAWLGEIERAAQAFHGGLDQTFSPVSYDLNCSPENSQEMASLVSSQDRVLLVIASACDPFDSQFAQSVSDAGQNIVWLAQGQTNLPDLPPGNLLLQTSSDPVGTQDQALGLVSAVSRWVFDLFDPPAQVTSTGGIVLGRQSVRSRLEQVETIESSGWRWDCSPDRTCLLIQSGVN